MAQPNTGNPAFFGTKVSKPGVNITKASPTDLVYSNDYTTTTYYDNSNSRILLGQLPDFTYGMWVSKPGNNVTDTNAATNNELIFNSNQDLFKILKSGSASVNATGTQTVYTTTIAHNLNFTPPSLVYAVFNPSAANDWVLLPYTGTGFDGSSGGIYIGLYIWSYTDNTNLYIKVVTGSNAGDEGLYNFQYYILQESL